MITTLTTCTLDDITYRWQFDLRVTWQHLFIIRALNKLPFLQHAILPILHPRTKNKTCKSESNDATIYDTMPPLRRGPTRGLRAIITGSGGEASKLRLFMLSYFIFFTCCKVSDNYSHLRSLGYLPMSSCGILGLTNIGMVSSFSIPFGWLQWGFHNFWY